MRKSLRQKVYDRSDWRCELCIPEACERGPLHVHHRKLRSQGGKDEPSNLLVVDNKCHDFIHAHPAQSYTNGWLVHSYEDPAMVEVKSFRRDRG